MSVIDKALAAITPAPSAEKRAEANAAARDGAVPGDWLRLKAHAEDQARLKIRHLQEFDRYGGG
jgi:hypothetical protein